MPQAVSVGSSGAVMGIFGAKVAELIFAQVPIVISFRSRPQGFRFSLRTCLANLGELVVAAPKDLCTSIKASQQHPQ
jgi:hypothetical protein